MSNPTSEAPTLSKSRRLFFALVLLALVGCFCFLGLEIFARIFDPKGISYYPETARFLDILIQEEPIGYRLPPDFTGDFHGVTYKFNSHGLRGRPVTPDKPEDEVRIVYLGDSMVFSLGVEEDHTIPHVLEKVINDKQPDGKKYRVVNMGVPSYNTEQEWVQFSSIGLEFQPDIVLLHFAPNDIHPKMWVLDKRKSPLVNLAQRSYAASLLFSSWRNLKRGMTGYQSLHDSKFRPDSEAWITMRDSMIAISKACHEREIPFLLIVPAAVESETPQGYQMLMDLGEEQGFKVAPFEPFDPALLKYRNSETDFHFNQEGCQLTGEALYELLLEQQLLKR